MAIGVMNAEPRGPSSVISAAVRGAVLACALLSACPAQAGGLRESLFGLRPRDGRDAPAPPVARYVTPDGDAFTLDRSQPKPLLKLENSFEVWALVPQMGPRGDTIYKNDLGEVVLRATRLGGITIFTEDQPGGEAAALAGPGNPLKLAMMGPQALGERLLQASARASRAARRLIPFEAEATPASSALIADAASVTSEAVVRMSKRSDARKLLDRIFKVRILEGRKAQAQLTQGVLDVTIAPPQGVAGRPSSDLIVHEAETFH
jgi:hypothetical protein